jgi:predicted phage terminase large subunit-like protein
LKDSSGRLRTQIQNQIKKDKREQGQRSALARNAPKGSMPTSAAPTPATTPALALPPKPLTPSIYSQQVLAKRVLARRRLLQFVKLTFPKFKTGWVHEDICDRLEKFSSDVVAGKSPRLMLLMPPRAGKSELASIRFPAWHLGHNPEHEIVNVGYNLDLPMKFSRRVRELMRDKHYQAIFPDTALDPESQAVGEWLTTRGGGFLAVGVGGGVTGKGATVLIIDDPLKNQEEADSLDAREKLWDWYQSTAYTRLSPGGGVLLIQTRWSDDDLAGRLLAAARAGPGDDGIAADQFEVVSYPALSESWEYKELSSGRVIREPEEWIALDGEPERVLLRPIDTCLHEARYPTDALKRIRANMDARIWSALYQQNPVPDSGMYFKREYFHRAPPLTPSAGARVFTAWDFAIGEKQTNDWTVGATVYQDEHDNVYVLDIHRMKADTFQIVEAMLDVALRWNTQLMGVEDTQIWRALKPVLDRRMQERKQYVPYEPLRPLTDKQVRARPLQGRMQQGKLWFPDNASWYDQAQQEMLRFPAGVHDDVVDALAWAAQMIVTRTAPRPVGTSAVLISWRDKLESDIVSGTGTHMAA